MTTPSKDSHPLLPEQEAVLSAVTSSPKNLLIECPAGGAKTFLLVQAAKRLPPSPVLAIAFNKRNAEDLSRRMPSFITCKTFNAIGHAAWQKVVSSRLNLSPRKTGDITRELLRETKAPSELFSPLREFIDGAKTLCYLPESPPRTTTFGQPISFLDLADFCDLPEPDSTLQALINEGLLRSIQRSFSGEIDFSDQIYMSLCFSGVFPKFPLIFVDEAQDLSPANIEMISRCLRPGGRLIAVGDRYQGIYAFRGADASAIETLTERFSLTPISADTTFRCPPEICDLARLRHPRITPFKPSGGQVLTWDTWSAESIPSSCAILCRNNAPLLGLALALFRSGRGANFIGGDLSKSLCSIIDRLGPGDIPFELAKPPLQAWREAETAKAEARNSPGAAARVADKAECILHLLSETSTLAEAKARCFAMFQPNASPVTLCTIHKSKGFEWPTVIFLDPWRIPSRYARQAAEDGDPSQLGQELNLRYVCQTRAEQTLIHANLDNFLSPSLGASS